MTEDMKKTVYTTMSEVFETMFFTYLEPMFEIPPREEWNASSDYLEASITYQGEISGSFKFYFPEPLARQITLNFLGIDDDALENRQIIDTVGETANMTVGSLLGKLDPQGSCTLGMPQTKKVGEFSPEKIVEAPGLYVYNTEFGLLWMVHNQNE